MMTYPNPSDPTPELELEEAPAVKAISKLQLSLNGPQIQHIERLEQKLMVFPIGLDKSPVGSGKTRSEMGLAKKLGLDLVVVSPKTVMHTWRSEAKICGVHIYMLMTYAGLIGKKPKYDDGEPMTLSHGLLTRQTITGQKHPLFVPTRKWDKLCCPKPDSNSKSKSKSNGILLVFDESQALKKKSIMNCAAGVLITDLVLKFLHQKDKEGVTPCFSKAMWLSGSPLCKSAYCISYMNMLSLNPANNYNQEIHSYLSQACRCPVLFEAAGDSLIKYVFPLISSTLPTPVITKKLDAKQGFYVLDEESELLIHTAMKRIRAILTSNCFSIGEFTEALKLSQTAKIGVSERLIRQSLIENPNSKVILFANYLDVIKILEERLSEYHPRILTGSVSEEDRSEIINDFQAPTLHCRLLIAQISVSSTGLNLQDNNGNFPRTSYVLPSFYFLEMFQSIKRAYRIGCQSDVKVRIIFANKAAYESKILDKINKSSRVLKSILTEQAHEGAKFLSDYEIELEHPSAGINMDEESEDNNNVISAENLEKIEAVVLSEKELKKQRTATKNLLRKMVMQEQKALDKEIVLDNESSSSSEEDENEDEKKERPAKKKQKTSSSSSFSKQQQQQHRPQSGKYTLASFKQQLLHGRPSLRL